ncbi:uncharacterized protein LOC135096683 [Scylla paramamosain]|uniref:uncharacterized protein LOC135096683 n=1 Tax=Scylla paramamosain TaxID=85552 RepID=UPI003082FAF8
MIDYNLLQHLGPTFSTYYSTNANSTPDIILANKHTYHNVINLIPLFEEMQPQLERRTRCSQALPTHTQVLLALRLFASGPLQNVIGDTAGPTQASVSRVFEHVCTMLSDKLVQEIKMLPTHLDQRRTAQQFFRIKNFPRVIGTIDASSFC